jgi:hypothetical protein
MRWSQSDKRSIACCMRASAPIMNRLPSPPWLVRFRHWSAGLDLPDVFKHAVEFAVEPAHPVSTIFSGSSAIALSFDP